jgi:Antibiotic biosynthesis monooxygenase
MYAAIRQMKMQPGLLDEAVRRIENGFVPLVSSIPGFVEYEGVQVGEDEGLTISVFETQEQAEARSLLNMYVLFLSTPVVSVSFVHAPTLESTHRMENRHVN